MMVSSGVERIILRPEPLLLDAPSTCRIHGSGVSVIGVGTGLLGVNYVTKSAMTCPLIATRGSYCMWYAPNSVAHFNILPVAYGLLRIIPRGYSVSTIIGKDWK